MNDASQSNYSSEPSSEHSSQHSSEPASPSTSSINAAHAQTFDHFDDRTALALGQAFGQESELEPLLALMQAQLQALCGVSGLSYTYSPSKIEYRLGEQARHSSDYNLTFRDVELGTLTLYYPQPTNQDATETAEDVVALAFIALRNAVTQMQLRALHQDEAKTAAENLTTAEQAALSKSSGDTRAAKTDSLILVALDTLPEIQDSDGLEWAEIVMSATHEQIQDGLRTADGVYHVGDDLIAVLLPNTSEQQALDVAKKIRLLIASLHLRGNAIDMQLTASMGVANAMHTTAATSAGAATAEDVMARARRALTRAQLEGRNQICVCVDAE